MRASSASARRARALAASAAAGAVTSFVGVLLLAAGEALRHLPRSDGGPLTAGGGVVAAGGLLLFGLPVTAAWRRNRSRTGRRHARHAPTGAGRYRRARDDGPYRPPDESAWIRDLRVREPEDVTGWVEDRGYVDARDTGVGRVGRAWTGGVGQARGFAGGPKWSTAAVRTGAGADDREVLHPTSIISPAWSRGRREGPHAAAAPGGADRYARVTDRAVSPDAPGQPVGDDPPVQAHPDAPTDPHRLVVDDVVDRARYPRADGPGYDDFQDTDPGLLSDATDLGASDDASGGRRPAAEMPSFPWDEDDGDGHREGPPDVLADLAGVAGDDGSVRDPAAEKEEKLAQLKDLYLTVEAIGEENVSKHFDEILRRQRELIGEYFRESGIGVRRSAGPGDASAGADPTRFS